MIISGFEKEDILEIASARINRAIARTLDSDPANKTQIAKLNGIKIKLECTVPVANFFIHFEDNSVLIKGSCHETTNLQVSGTGISLLKLATSPIDNAAALRGANVTINGDVGLLLEISHISKMIDIDWEELVADQVGETPAVIISRLFSNGLREAGKIQSNLSKKMTAKMRSETSPLPNKNDLDALKIKLRDVNYRLDRIEAKSARTTKITVSKQS